MARLFPVLQAGGSAQDQVKFTQTMSPDKAVVLGWRMLHACTLAGLLWPVGARPGGAMPVATSACCSHPPARDPAGSGNNAGTQCLNADGNAAVQMTVEQNTSSPTLGRKPGVFEQPPADSR